MQVVDAERMRAVLDFRGLVDALCTGLAGPPPVLDDVLLADADRRLLVRAAWFPGGSAGVKAVTLHPANAARTPPLPTVQGILVVFDEETGAPRAVLDGAEITAWKTAADSALGSELLSRPSSRTLVMIGAGAMAEPLLRAHIAVRPAIVRILIWNRTRDRAEALAERIADLGRDVIVADDRISALAAADIVSCATMSDTPVIPGAVIADGAHVDLVGAYTPTMREADDALLRRGRLFVDSRQTTIGEIGELIIPMEAGVISEADVVADLHDLANGAPGRRSAREITVFKNGGGAHLDLLVARHVLARLANAAP